MADFKSSAVSDASKDWNSCRSKTNSLGGDQIFQSQVVIEGQRENKIEMRREKQQITIKIWKSKFRIAEFSLKDQNWHRNIMKCILEKLF